MSEPLVVVARLARTRGIRGELIGDSLTSHPERFEALRDVTLRSPSGSERPASVEQVWNFRGRPVFKFQGVDSINDAEPLAGYEVCVKQEERVELEEGEYFLADLVGCEVRDASGERIGELAGWQETAGPVLLEIDDGTDQEPILVPFVGAIFRTVDVAARLVVVDLPPGLRELNRS